MSWITLPAHHSTPTYFRTLKMHKPAFELIQGSESPQGFGLNMHTLDTHFKPSFFGKHS